MIYIASPYSDIDERVIEKRYRGVARYTAKILKEGEIAFSPIVHGHHISIQYGLPETFDFWEKYCLGMLYNACELRVLKLDGWQTSKGVTAEISFADEHGIPITFVNK